MNKRPTVVNYANRGMGLQTLIDHANMQYRMKGLANIERVSTPWNVVRQGNRIISAFPEGLSTVDYMGEVGEDAESICFEAKQNKKPRFPLDNYEEHQIEFMRRWRGHKFTIMEWVMRREIYRVPFELTAYYWDNQAKGGRKSIPYEEMTKEWLLTPGRGIVLDYLNGVI